jgi:hypothetical protein
MVSNPLMDGHGWRRDSARTAPNCLFKLLSPLPIKKVESVDDAGGVPLAMKSLTSSGGYEVRWPQATAPAKMANAQMIMAMMTTVSTGI